MICFLPEPRLAQGTPRLTLRHPCCPSLPSAFLPLFTIYYLLSTIYCLLYCLLSTACPSPATRHATSFRIPTSALATHTKHLSHPTLTLFPLAPRDPRATLLAAHWPGRTNDFPNPSKPSKNDKISLSSPSPAGGFLPFFGVSQGLPMSVRVATALAQNSRQAGEFSRAPSKIIIWNAATMELRPRYKSRPRPLFFFFSFSSPARRRCFSLCSSSSKTQSPPCRRRRHDEQCSSWPAILPPPSPKTTPGKPVASRLSALWPAYPIPPVSAVSLPPCALPCHPPADAYKERSAAQTGRLPWLASSRPPHPLTAAETALPSIDKHRQASSKSCCPPCFSFHAHLSADIHPPLGERRYSDTRSIS